MLLQYRVLFPLFAFAAVAIASENYGPIAEWAALAVLPIYLLAPVLPVRNLRRSLLPDRPPAHIVDQWSAICQG